MVKKELMLLQYNESWQMGPSYYKCLYSKENLLGELKKIKKHPLVKNKQKSANCQKSLEQSKYCEKNELLMFGESKNILILKNTMLVLMTLRKYLQPLDISINKPFKSKIRSKYTKYCLD